MGAFGVVMVEPFIEIYLKLLDGLKQGLAERDLIKLLQDRFVETLADAIGLRRLHLGFGMLDVIDGQEKLVIVFIDTPQYSVPRSVMMRSTGRSCSS